MTLHRLGCVSQRFGKVGHLLQTLVVGILIVLVRFDQDHTGRPLWPRRRAQILKAEQETSDPNIKNTVPVRLVLQAAAGWPDNTHHFRGDVGIREVSVLTHNRQVAVHVYGQGVSSQDHDPAEGSHMCHHGGTLPARSNDFYTVTMKEVLEQFLTLSLLCWWISELL